VHFGKGIVKHLFHSVAPADTAGSENNFMAKHGGTVVFAGAALLFAMVAVLMGLPGPDGNANSTYDVITRLAHTFTYRISRTPGQPFLDYSNFILWSVGGDRLVQAWYVLISALGVSILYRLLQEIRGCSPLAGACALALHPMFLAHVGGVGDFAVSLAFLLGALWAGVRGRVVVAGLALGMAVGCRLPLCLNVVPVAFLVGMAWRNKGASSREAIAKAASTGLLAGAVSLLMFAPLFAFYGASLMKNFPMQSLRYHVSAFGYRLLVGYGAAFWAIAAGAFLWRMRRRGPAIPPKARNGIGAAAVMIVLGSLATEFRVPGKPEYALPFLVGAILLFQVCSTKAWTYALLLSSLAVGVAVPSPYDNRRDVYGLQFTTGWYFESLTAARDNRLQINAVRDALASLPPRTVLVARCSWTEEQARMSDLEAISSYQGIQGLRAFAFAGLGEGKIALHFQEPKLREWLDQNQAAGPGQRMSVVYDEGNLGLLRRWGHLDLAQYGKPVVLGSAPLEALWRHAGQSVAGVVGSAGR
jgi:hypothetical protein